MRSLLSQKMLLHVTDTVTYILYNGFKLLTDNQLPQLFHGRFHSEHCTFISIISLSVPTLLQVIIKED